MFSGIGMSEVVLILVIALVIFGPRKLPEIGKSLGKTINEFRRASLTSFSELDSELKTEATKEAVKKEEPQKEDKQAADSTVSNG